MKTVEYNIDIQWEIPPVYIHVEVVGTPPIMYTVGMYLNSAQIYHRYPAPVILSHNAMSSMHIQVALCVTSFCGTNGHRSIGDHSFVITTVVSALFQMCNMKCHVNMSLLFCKALTAEVTT